MEEEAVTGIFVSHSEYTASERDQDDYREGGGRRDRGEKGEKGERGERGERDNYGGGGYRRDEDDQRYEDKFGTFKEEPYKAKHYSQYNDEDRDDFRPKHGKYGYKDPLQSPATFPIEREGRTGIVKTRGGILNLPRR